MPWPSQASQRPPAVEREARGGEAADARFFGFGVELANGIPEADVGGGAGARRLADRRLVDFEHAADRLPAAHPGATGQRHVLVPALGADQAPQVVVDHFAAERGFARARDTGDHAEPAERDARGEALEVMQIGTDDVDRRRGRGHRAARLQRVAQRFAQETAGDRCLAGHQLLGGAGGHHMAAL